MIGYKTVKSHWSAMSCFIGRYGDPPGLPLGPNFSQFNVGFLGILVKSYKIPGLAPVFIPNHLGDELELLFG